MSITVIPFQMSANGNVTPTGHNIELSNLSYNGLTGGLVNKQKVTGMPNGISSSHILYTKSHCSDSYIKIYSDLNTTDDSVYIIADQLRITYGGGTCKFKNTFLYAFTTKLDTVPTDVSWKILFADSNKQSIGDYWDVTLPDSFNYNVTYLMLMLVSDGYGQITPHEVEGYYNMSPVGYFVNNSTYSTIDQGQCHCLITRGISNISFINLRLIVAWEDKTFSVCDRDYNDVILILESSITVGEIEENIK